jgi:hypothetical protein
MQHSPFSASVASPAMGLASGSPRSTGMLGHGGPEACVDLGKAGLTCRFATPLHLMKDSFI